MAWNTALTGLSPAGFAALVATLRASGADRPRRGRPWSLPLERRVLLVAAYWRTNLTLRHLAGLFSISKSAADRIVDALAPYLALETQCARCRRPVEGLVDGALVPLSGPGSARGAGELRYAPRRRLRIDRSTRIGLAADIGVLDVCAVTGCVPAVERAA
ncbi:transposase family protein [Streptomyces sp. NPDC020681]|uniref:transposase family protein n=1 Tax=Streptomyces sp. NPDC020681 TaxID=3365083 RepID=UPI003792AD57